jgi:CBS domain-containing protein
MIVEELMTKDPACCHRDTPLPEVARLMIERDCGCIPVVGDDGRPVGVITDRDIVCRAVAFERDPTRLVAEDCMTGELVAVSPSISAESCCKVLEENQIRRAVVVDDVGRCCGIVAQADLARRSEVLGGEVVAAVSAPSDAASSVH